MQANREYTAFLQEETATLNAERKARKKASPVPLTASPTTAEADDEVTIIAVKKAPLRPRPNARRSEVMAGRKAPRPHVAPSTNLWQ